jgi:hypothetical protein
MKRLSLIAGFFFLGAITSVSAGSKVSLVSFTKELTEGYKAKVDQKKKWRLAILDIAADKDLVENEVPPILNEMITHEFVKTPEFIVLERELFDKILKEHELQATFGDMESAVKVGRVLGAQVVFVGRATQIQKNIRLNGRLVNTETSEILSTAVQDIPRQAFKREPAQATSVASQDRKLGFSVIYSFQAKGSNETVSQTSVDGLGPVTETLRYEPPSPNWVGAKLSYYFHDDLFADFSYQVEARKQSLGRIDFDYASAPDVSYDVRAQGRLIRVGVGVNKPLSPRWEASVSGGVGSLTYNPKANGAGVEAEVDKTFPYIGAGISFAIESRLAVGINLAYDIATFEGKFKKNDQTVFKLNPFTVGPAVTFYF